jgi:Uncharacterized protein conserved in bacteria
MTVDSVSVRELWAKEQPMYEKYGLEIENEVKSLLKQIGIYGDVSFRTKEADSLIKKLYRKSKAYDEIHDKVGARAIVQFKNNLFSLDQEICKYYGARIKKRDDKAKSLSEYEFGYQSIHYDISNNEENLYCELQIRTVCQHNWSMMSHSLAYKKEDIPLEIKRKINALSALFEIADTQFQNICNSIAALPEVHEITIINLLEKRFYSICTCEYDHEMTNEFMTIYQSLYNDKDENALEKLSMFYSTNFEKLKRIISRADNVFYTQPEILIILERLTNKKLYFKTKWAELYPLELLEEIANVWGMSIE